MKRFFAPWGLRALICLSLVFALAAGCDKQSEPTGPGGTDGPDGPGTVDQIVLEANVSILPADGSSQARLTAVARDADGLLVADGNVISFGISSGSGQILVTQVETEGGIAMTDYVAGTSAGPVTIMASAGGVQANYIVMLSSDPEESGLIFWADQISLLADGETSTRLHARFINEDGSRATEGIPVGFTTTLGEIEDVQPTDSTGTASARLRSSRFITGTARVTALSGAFVETLDVNFVSEAAAHIELVGVDPPSIGVAGTGQPEVATLSFVVRDANGIPLDADHSVELFFEIYPLDEDTDATVYPLSATSNEQGRVLTSVNAGVISGVVQVWAETGLIEVGPIPLAIHGGLPAPEFFDLAFERVNVAGLLYSGIENQVTAFVGDKHGNPVPVGTMVWFNTVGGIIGGSDGTDELGRSVVTHLTADPRPGSDGLVQVCAKTIPAGEFAGAEGDTLVECNFVMWSGATEIEFLSPDILDVPNAGAVDIAFRVSDANGNPLTGGTTITVATTEGVLFGDTVVTLPDTQSSTYTFFGVSLSDDDAEDDLARAVGVTVTVVSQNGNRAAYKTGTIH